MQNKSGGISRLIYYRTGEYLSLHIHVHLHMFVIM